MASGVTSGAPPEVTSEVASEVAIEVTSEVAKEGTSEVAIEVGSEVIQGHSAVREELRSEDLTLAVFLQSH